jgi:hypothetical protein
MHDPTPQCLGMGVRVLFLGYVVHEYLVKMDICVCCIICRKGITLDLSV